MGEFMLDISEGAVKALMKAQSDIEGERKKIENASKELKASFEENRGGMDPVLDSLKKLIDDLEEATTGSAVQPLISFEKKILLAAQWRAKKLSEGGNMGGVSVKTKKLTRH